MIYTMIVITYMILFVYTIWVQFSRVFYFHVFRGVVRNPRNFFPYNTIINDYCHENLYPRKFSIKEDFSNPRNIEPSKICTHTVY